MPVRRRQDQTPPATIRSRSSTGRWARVVTPSPYPESSTPERRGPGPHGRASGDRGRWREAPMGLQLFTAYSYDAVHTVLGDGDAFSSAGYAEVMGVVFGHSILEMDEPEHHAYRSLLQQAFTRKAMERWEAELVGAARRRHDRRVRRRRPRRSRAQLLFPFPRHRDRRAARPARRRTSPSSTAGGRADRRGHRLGPRRRARRPSAAGLLRRHPRRAPGRPGRRHDLRAGAAPSTTASGSPTRRSSPSAGCCCRPAPRPPTARRPTCCSVCCPTRSSSTRCAPTARSCRRRSRRASAGSRRC